MALRKQLTFSGVTEVKTDYGVLTQGATSLTLNAYIKVEEARMSKGDALAVVSFTDGTARLTMTTPFTASVDDGAKNVIAQAYEALKQMPMFAGAEDC
jgi:hypothetical protein